MSFNFIKQGLDNLKKCNSLKFLLIEYYHKKFPREFTCYDVNFKNQDLLINTISEMYNSFIETIEKKDYSILEYTGESTKNTIDKLSVKTSPLIKESWSSLINSISSSCDSHQINDIKANAYIFVGTYKNIDNSNYENIYLLSKKNPVINLKKCNVFTSKDNTIDISKDPIIQFNKCFDAIIYKDIMYSINSNFETVFNIEYTYKKICNKSLDLISKANIVNDMESYIKYATSGHIPRKFMSYNESLVEKLQNTYYMNIFSSNFNIPIDKSSNKLDLSNTKHAEQFTKFICEKIKKNIFDENFCEVPTFTPIKIY